MVFYILQYNIGVCYVFGSSRLRQKYYAPQVQPHQSSNQWPPDHGQYILYFQDACFSNGAIKDSLSWTVHFLSLRCPPFTTEPSGLVIIDSTFPVPEMLALHHWAIRDCSFYPELIFPDVFVIFGNGMPCQVAYLLCFLLLVQFCTHVNP